VQGSPDVTVWEKSTAFCQLMVSPGATTTVTGWKALPTAHTVCVSAEAIEVKARAATMEEQRDRILKIFLLK
jgi:hypothetical protein